GTYASSRELKSGNINTTYLLEYRDGDREIPYTLQKINTYVFRDPEGVMRNIEAVTAHIRGSLRKSGGSADRQVLELVRTDAGDVMHRDAEGGVWRVYRYIADAMALDVVRDHGQMEEVGSAFGRFQRCLSDFPAHRLTEAIPDFHNTPVRFGTFMRSVRADAAGRAAEAGEEIDFFMRREGMMGEIVRLLGTGGLPLRVTHNDTKSNNVLLDSHTGKSLCVIDLDTVMPGSSLYDYGDMVRFGASAAKEDEEDASRVRLDMDKARAFTRGFIRETAGFLQPGEIERLPLGIKVITAELAMRFLTDYLDGDKYFKTDGPRHNLVRARAQIALLKDVERREAELEDMAGAFLRAYA
ncbi:MAG TPA: aminoglycoside phosphotransferase family protein, partial [Candidatus Limnocylindria bacterium]|nr:aminoglycoside phosphotransferase family protein [Candidatus Limnocylindria bacterium]